jgi:hypothetical protein
MASPDRIPIKSTGRKLTISPARATPSAYSSEPLTSDASTWLEVPEYSMLTAWTEDGGLRVRTQDLDL